MPRMRGISEERIRSLPLAPKGKRYDVTDGAVPGLLIRVGAKSKKFVLLARYGGAKNPTRRTIGAFPILSLEVAREIASQWNVLVERGSDPRKEERRIKAEESLRRRRTFRSVMEDYLATLPFRKRNRHAQDDIKTIRREFLNPDRNPWINKPISDVTDIDVAELIAAIRDRPAPAQAYDTFGQIRTFFAWAISPERRIAYGLNANPIVSVQPKHLGLSRQVRTHVLSVNELRAYWRAAEATEYPLGPFLQGLVLTGVRRSEWAKARWSEIDWARKLWIVPKARFKAGEEHLVPLSREVILLLENLRRNQPEGHGDFIFSKTNGQKPFNGFSNDMKMFRPKMQAAFQELEPGAVARRWVLHDTRRVVRTGLSALNVPDVIAEAVIGHGKTGIRRVYDQYRFLPQARSALSRWATQLMLVIEGSISDFCPDELDPA